MPPESELLRQWLERADADLRISDTLLNSGQPETIGICFHCQQAIEKSIKTWLIYRDIEFHWSHDIEYLLDLCQSVEPLFEQFRPMAQRLTEFAVTFRHPSIKSDPTLEEAHAAFATAQRVMHFVVEQLPRDARWE